MKKFFLLLFSCINLFIFSACFKIQTPEELLASPQLNTEKKEMKAAVEKFRPPNTVNYPILVSEEKRSLSMVIRDLDADSTSEIISFYKNKLDDKIGMFILKKVDSLWIKKADISFNTYEISKLTIADLDNNHKKELIVESYETENKVNPKNYSVIYFKNKEVQIIKEVPYIVMKLSDIRENGKQEILSITKNTESSDYVLNISSFNGKTIQADKTKLLKILQNPYNMSIGYIYENQMAIFIDYIGEKMYENTEILLYNAENNNLSSLSDNKKYAKNNYQFNVQSKDIDNDGIVEVGYKFKAPNYTISEQDVKDSVLVDGFFKIKKDFSLQLVKEVYDDLNKDYIINIPKSFTGNYTISVSNDNLSASINYITRNGKEYPLILINSIKKYEWLKDASLRKQMQLITENQDYVIAGKVPDYSDRILDVDKENYDQLRSEVLIISNIVKERSYQ